MGLKILHTADWHLDSPFAGFSQGQRRLLREQQMALPEKIGEICRREHCDLVLLAGDVFDAAPSQQTVDCVRRALAECAVPVFISPGNHDFCAPGSPWIQELWPENVTVFRGGMESVALPALDCRIYGAGYQSMDCPALLSDFRVSGGERYQIAVLHADPLTAGSPYCPITAAQLQDCGLTYLALGHIHKAGSLRVGRTLCAWPGCPMGRGWDETQTKGVFITELNGQAQVRFLPLEGITFYDLEADVSEGTGVLAELLPAAGCDDFFRITLTGEADVDLQGLKRDYDRFPNLIFRDRTEPAGDLWQAAGEDSLRGTYFRMLHEENTDAAVLAARISRKILAGREVSLP